MVIRRSKWKVVALHGCFIIKIVSVGEGDVVLSRNLPAMSNLLTTIVAKSRVVLVLANLLVPYVGGPKADGREYIVNVSLLMMSAEPDETSWGGK